MESPLIAVRPTLPSIFTVLVLSLLAGCETPRTFSSAGPKTVAVPGQQQTTISRFQVPLPPGDWREAYSGSKDLSRGTSYRKILVEVSGDVMDRVILIYQIEIGRRDYFKPRKSCRHEEYFFQTTTVSEKAMEDCWHVRNVSMGLKGDPHWINKALDLYARKMDLFAPAVWVGTRFIRHKDSDLLQVDYLWNPEVLLPRSDGRVWAVEDWSNSPIAGDPRRKIVMDEIRRWGQDWHPRMEQALPF